MATDRHPHSAGPAWHPLTDGAGHPALEVLPPPAILNLRGPAGDDGFLDAVATATGIRPPVIANRRVSGGIGRAIFWLGPDEWLLVAPGGEPAALEQAIRSARGEDPWLAITDLTHNYVGLALNGPQGRTALSCGCSLDLHPRGFQVDDCAQTTLARARVLLALTDEAPRFEIWVRNSFARYLAGWLDDALRLVA